jgi:hypothetical protein
LAAKKKFFGRGEEVITEDPQLDLASVDFQGSPLANPAKGDNVNLAKLLKSANAKGEGKGEFSNALNVGKGEKGVGDNKLQSVRNNAKGNNAKGNNNNNNNIRGATKQEIQDLILSSKNGNLAKSVAILQDSLKVRTKCKRMCNFVKENCEDDLQDKKDKDRNYCKQTADTCKQVCDTTTQSIATQQPPQRGTTQTQLKPTTVIANTYVPPPNNVAVGKDSIFPTNVPSSKSIPQTQQAQIDPDHVFDAKRDGGLVGRSAFNAGSSPAPSILGIIVIYVLLNVF